MEEQFLSHYMENASSEAPQKQSTRSGGFAVEDGDTISQSSLISSSQLSSSNMSLQHNLMSDIQAQILKDKKERDELKPPKKKRNKKRRKANASTA